MKRRRGFVFIMALFLVALVAVTTMVITSLLRYDLKRTREETSDVQLRQLLLAGAMDAPAHLTAGESQWETRSPIGAVKTHVDDSECVVTATLEDGERSERVSWVRDGMGWKLVGVR